MAKLKVRLARNLRKNIMRGHPWVYKNAIEVPNALPSPNRAQLCQVIYGKNELGWAIYDPRCPIALRMLSTENAPPNANFFNKRFSKALALRSSLLEQGTNAYRLFNGEGDLLPGLVCDVYNTDAVLQFDGSGPGEFWDKKQITEWLLNNTRCTRVLEKLRTNASSGSERIAILHGNEDSLEDVLIQENGVQFKVNIEKGQKTGFFLDQRDNRNYVRHTSKGKSLLNLFSYTGGFSVYAGIGGATRVASLDSSKGAVLSAQENWELNGLTPSLHEGLCVDVFDYLSTEKEMWDHIVVDPPSMAHSENQKEAAKRKYIEVFAASAKRVKPSGQLSVSSCTGHISFEDFFEIISEALSLARRSAQILRVSGQGPDHPYPHACPEMRYLKFVHLAL